MAKFDEEYQKLNLEQRRAVDMTSGPLLVLAGPGTGKTQLLSMRVANILKQPDVSASDILCLTFTDNAARNMLERINNIVGLPAYHVGIYTFHSFGSDIINQYPDYFTERVLLQPIDQLGSYEILRDCFEKLPHSNPLSAKIGEEYIFIKDALSVISWLKQNAVSPDEFGEIIAANQSFFDATSKPVQSVFAHTPSPKYLSKYKKLADSLAKYRKSTMYHGLYDYGSLCLGELSDAIDQTDQKSRYAQPITAWRKAWLQKNSKGQYVFKDSGRALDKLKALRRIYLDFQNKLAESGLYDFDDMVLEVVQALENSQELRLNLQERYQYILIDEFQDTNKAQLRIIEALGDNPVNEGRPNIMAVGDPNQAIYAFQGAQSSNIDAFTSTYKDVEVINLTDNYRSTQSILNAATTVIENSDSKIGLKKLRSQISHSTNVLEHDVLSSELEQYGWVAEKISGYLKSGHRPDDIAIIAPKHKYLERLMTYLAEAHIPVAYERRENILDAAVVVQLLKMAELVTAIANGSHDEVDILLGEVLSYPFWGLPTEELINISVDCYDNHKHWLPVLYKHKDRRFRKLALWFSEISRSVRSQPMEYILDRLSGNEEASIDDVDAYEESVGKPKKTLTFVSPFRSYYFGSDYMENSTSEFLTHLGQLSTLRQHLRSWKPATMLHIGDLVEFVKLHREAKLKIVDTNPHTQSTNAVQVMTAYKAKGLEFGIVFVINAQDEVWGISSRSKTDRIRLPKNMPLKPVGDTKEDKLRLFFVALTRAKHTLHITSYTHNLDNKLSLGLSFLGGNTIESEPTFKAFKPRVISRAKTVKSTRILSTDWAYRYQQIIADKPTLFEPILANYKLSVTHLNNFLDVVNGGPRYFLLHNLLRFPAAMSPPAAYGDAVHKSLQWAYSRLKSDGKLPAQAAIVDYFSDILSRKHLPVSEFKRLKQRGQKALEKYISVRSEKFKSQHIIERGFTNEGAVVARAHLSGKIDKMILGNGNSLQLIDFKTGKPSSSWQGKDDYEKRKLHRYEQQLMFYKLLVENSASFKKKYSVSTGGLEFIETDDSGELTDILELKYDSGKLSNFNSLIRVVWQHINDLDFPDISSYGRDLKAVIEFENDLLNRKI